MRAYVTDPVRPDAYPVVSLTWILFSRQYAGPVKSEQVQHLFGESLGYAPRPLPFGRL